jgi:hypothetical protein
MCNTLTVFLCICDIMLFMNRSPYKRLTLDFEPELHHRLKQVALDRQTTVKALMEECAKKIVAAASQPPRPEGEEEG